MGDEGNRERRGSQRLEPIVKARPKPGKGRIVLAPPRAGVVLVSPRPKGKAIPQKTTNAPQTQPDTGDRFPLNRKMSLPGLQVPEIASPKFRNRSGSDPHKATLEKRIRTDLFSIARPNIPISIHKCYSYTQIGSVNSRPKPENQDSVLYVQVASPIGEFSILGVCDGHGQSGHLVSGFVAKQLPICMRESVSAAGRGLDIWSRVMKDSYEKCVTDLKHQNFDTVSSGCTCVTVIVHSGQLICANVGDSRAVLARCRDDGSINAVELSRDQKPDVPEERQRIEAAGGRVEPLTDGEGVTYGPARVWFPNEDSPGLAMSRAMGDSLASSLGVISTPGIGYSELFSLYLTPGDLFLVLASDGIWEFISSQEAVSIVNDSVQRGRAETCCERLVEEATRRWKREEDCVDDITVIVAFLEGGK